MEGTIIAAGLALLAGLGAFVLKLLRDFGKAKEKLGRAEAEQDARKFDDEAAADIRKRAASGRMRPSDPGDTRGFRDRR